MNMNDVGVEKPHLMKILTISAEFALMVYIGSLIGAYLESKIITVDCQSVGIAKVGATYMQCSPLEAKKPIIIVPQTTLPQGVVK